MLVNVIYNLKIANIFNINTAILLSYICNLSSSEEVTISREDVFKHTGLEEKAQIDSEFILVKSNLILVKEFKNNKNKYYCKVNKDLLNKVMISDNVKEVLAVDNIEQLIRTPKPKIDKKELLKNNLKKRIKVPDPVIQTYFIQWIDSVYENPKGFLTSGSVDIAQKELNDFSKGNQKIQIDVLKIAIKGGLRDLTWAIQRYKEINTTSKAPIHFNDYNSIKSSDDNIGGEEY